tara:strand:+ start:3038 stop:3277 length:240 start_codon:yes stop_codon:yes gene_type:complete
MMQRPCEVDRVGEIEGNLDRLGLMPRPDWIDSASCRPSEGIPAVLTELCDKGRLWEATKLAKSEYPESFEPVYHGWINW